MAWVERGSLVITEPIRYPGRGSPGLPAVTGIPVIGRFFMIRREPGSLFWPTVTREPTFWFDVPLWQMSVVLLGVGWWARSPRVPSGTCACGYDLAGLAGDGSSRTCPECGRVWGVSRETSGD